MLIKRKAYTRKDGTKVSATSFQITNRGKPGRGPKLFTLKKGRLSRYGYPNRGRNALANAVTANGALGVFRRLQALMILTKRTDPAKSAQYRSNRNWVRSKYMSH